MNNIYNAIQNLYNMNKTTWQEVLAELYNLVSKIENKFDLFEAKFGSLLGEQVTRELKKMYNDGSLASLINDVLLKDINKKVDTFKIEVNEQLDTKANKTNIYISDFREQDDIDDTPSFNRMMEYCKINRGTICILSQQEYLISSTINIPVDTSILGNGATIVMKNEGNYVNGFAFYYNIDNDNNVIDLNPRFRSNISNLKLEVENECEAIFGNYNGFYVCQQIVFTNLEFSYIDMCIKMHTNYTDLAIFDTIYIRRRKESQNYALDSGSQGDQRRFINCTHGAYLGGGVENAKVLKIGKTHYMTSIKNCLFGGDILIESPCIVENSMMSYDYRTRFYIKGADVKFTGLYASISGERRIEVDTLRRGKSTYYPNITFENCIFAVDNSIKSYSNNLAPINLINVGKVLFINCFNALNSSSKMDYGLSALNIEGLPIYKKYAPYLDNIVIDAKKGVLQNFSVNKYLNADTQINSATCDNSNSNWRGTEQGTLYYQQIFYADIERKIGKSVGAEKSVTLSDGKGVRLQYNQTKGFMRLFRGVISGVYTKYVDIPLNGVNSVLFDDGVSVNGYLWKDIGTMDFNTLKKELFTTYEILEYKNNGTDDCKLTVYAPTVPTKGTWKVYDECITILGERKIYNGTAWV